MGSGLKEGVKTQMQTLTHCLLVPPPQHTHTDRLPSRVNSYTLETKEAKRRGAQKYVCCCQQDTNLDTTVKGGRAAGAASQNDAVQSINFPRMSITLMPACETTSTGLPFPGS